MGEGQRGRRLHNGTTASVPFFREDKGTTPAAEAQVLSAVSVILLCGAVGDIVRRGCCSLKSEVAMAASWEEAIRDGVLKALLEDNAVGLKPWDLAPPPYGPRVPRKVCTLADLKSCRETSSAWKEMIDSSAEWAAHCLAKYEWDQIVSKWDDPAVFKARRFEMTWRVFGKSWRLVAPFAYDALRVAALGTLNEEELLEVWKELWSNTNTEIEVADGEKLHPSPLIWVAHGHRA